MVGWHHLFNGRGFGQTPGEGEGQGGLACCNPRGCTSVRHDLATVFKHLEAATFEGRTEVKEEEPEMEPEQGTRWEGEIQESVILRKLKEERLYKGKRSQYCQMLVC